MKTLLLNKALCFFSLGYTAAALSAASSLEPPEGIDEEVKTYIEAAIADALKKQKTQDEQPVQSTKKDFEFGGYFRVGSNYLASGGAKTGGSCFSLPYPKNDGIYYRLGNECRDFGELRFTRYLSKNGVDYKVVFMMDVAGDSRGPTNVEPWSRRYRDLYVQADNLLPNGNLWIGRRFYRAIAVGDIHVMDAFYVQSSGNGFGVSDITLGDSNKMHVAFMGYGQDNATKNPLPADEVNFQNILADIRTEHSLGNSGNLKFALQNLIVRDANDSDPTEGATFTLQWEKGSDYLDHKTAVQYATGSMAENPGCFGTDGGCFNYQADSGSTAYRVINNGTLNLSHKLKLHYNLIYQDSEDYHKLKSVGLRPHYSLTDHWSLLAEIGYNALEPVARNGVEQKEQKLTKIALALQATADSTDFWDRPSFRFYVSNFSWNDAAGLSVPGKEDDNAVVIGAQVEIWF